MAQRDRPHGRSHQVYAYISIFIASNELGTQLKEGLKRAGSNRDWSHITSQIGRLS